MPQVVLLLLLATASASAEPRQVDEAERAGVAIAAAFLANGPAAVIDELSADAPLRMLPREDAIAEVAARLGPHERASWSLQTLTRTPAAPHDVAFRIAFPSGADEAVLFRMKRDGPHWRIRDVITSAELPVTPPSQPEREVPPWRTPLLIAAMILAAAGGLLWKRARLAAAVAIFAAALAVGAAVYLPSLAPQEAPLPIVELRRLAPLRAALARGDDVSLPSELSTAERDTARLWILNAGIPLRVPGTQSDPLGGLGTMRQSLLAELVRARIALVNGRTAEAQAAFERALAIRPTRDDLLIDAATSFAGAEADAFLAQSRMPDARDEDLYYARARRASAGANETEARQHLRAAWTLRPLPREELVRDARLFGLLDDVAVAAMVSLHSTEEPARRSRVLGASPLRIPPVARAAASGEFLRLEIGEAALDVPGGAALAPENVRVVPATYWAAEDDARALRDVNALLERPDRSVAPGARVRVTRTANALARHNRWLDLVTLTADVTPQTAGVSPELLVLRITALLRLGRDADARALAGGESVRQLTAARSHPGTLISIADALTGVGALDVAERLYDAATSPEHAPLVAARKKQIELRRALIAGGKSISTEHFDIRHDASMNPAIASRIGDLLEAELARLRSKLPPVDLRRVTVNVLSWEDFRGGFTGSDHILGLYDGEILFPFAVVNQFKPEVVAIITHELTHALVAQASGDNAPRWFQEGLAQTMELVPVQRNAFNDTPPELVVPIPLLDALMENAADRLAMEQGYTVAQTFVRFLLDRYGAGAADTMITEFSKGRNTDEALQTLTGKTPDALNREFRDWGFRHSANFTNSEPFPYGRWYSPDIDPRVREGFSFGVRRQ